MAEETSGPIWLARVLAGLGLVLLVWSLFTGFQVGASEDWPSVTGRVLRAEVESSTSVGGRRSAGSTTYSPDVAYDYEVEGREYRGDRLTVVTLNTSSPDPVRAALGSIQKGARVKVHYDPENPARSVLIPGEGGRLSYYVIFGFVLFGAAFAAVVFDALRPEPRRLRRRRPIRGPGE